VARPLGLDRTLIFLCQLASQLTKVQRSGSVALDLAAAEFVDADGVDLEWADGDQILQEVMAAIRGNEVPARPAAWPGVLLYYEILTVVANGFH
jgi:hypothetical protein